VSDACGIMLSYVPATVAADIAVLKSLVSTVTAGAWWASRTAPATGRSVSQVSGVSVERTTPSNSPGGWGWPDSHSDAMSSSHRGGRRAACPSGWPSGPRSHARAAGANDSMVA
jgi:hypothetical protein